MRAHGTKAAYVWGVGDGPGDGCRCDQCREAARIYGRQRRHAITPAYVDAQQTRGHVDWLATQGVGLKTVADASGVSHGALSKLIYGDPQRGTPPTRRIRRTTEDKVLAVTPADGANGSRIPAAPTLALVRRLVAAGVPKTRIAERIGQTSRGLQLGTRYVTRHHARIIAAMAAELDNGTLDTVRYVRSDPRPVPMPTTDRLRARVEQRDRTRRHRGQPTAEEERAADTDRLFDGLADTMRTRGDDWRRRAACRTQPTWLFYPSSNDHETTARALAVCAGCPVRAQCLRAHRCEDDGIFGGTTSLQRQTLGATA